MITFKKYELGWVTLRIHYKGSCLMMGPSLNDRHLKPFSVALGIPGYGRISLVTFHNPNGWWDLSKFAIQLYKNLGVTDDLFIKN